MIRIAQFLLCLLLPMCLASLGFANPRTSPVGFDPVGLFGDDDDDDKDKDKDKDKKDEDEDEDEEDEEDADRYLAVVGGDVYSGNGAVLRGATILAKNGVIEEIGFDVWLPDETEILNAEGMRVYPGMVAIESSSNITVSQDRSVQVDLGHVHAPDFEFDPLEVLADLAAELTEARAAVEDSYDPFGQNLVLALSTGITSTVSGGAAIKLKRGEIDHLVMNEGSLASFSWSSKNPGGKRDLREKFKKTSGYLREYREWEGRPKSRKDEDAPSDKAADKNVLAVLKGEKRAKFTSNERGDLLAIARLAQTYGFRPVIEGCIEGWTVAGELGRAGATAIITPRDRRNKDEELMRDGGSTIENAAILYEHGVQIAIIPSDTSMNLGGIMGRDLMHLPIEVGFAIRGGLPESAALDAVTIVPARLLGISHRVGTLEQGKDCDLIVTDGDLLHYQTFVQYTVVDGKIAYDKQDELFFAHIRPRAEPEEVLDPGEEVDEELDAEDETEDEAESLDEESDEEEPESDDDNEDDDGDDDGDDPDSDEEQADDSEEDS